MSVMDALRSTPAKVAYGVGGTLVTLGLAHEGQQVLNNQVKQAVSEALTAVPTQTALPSPTATIAPTETQVATNTPTPTATEMKPQPTPTSMLGDWLGGGTPTTEAQQPAVVLPTDAVQPVKTDSAPTPTATETESESYTHYLEGLGIKVNIPREGWPVTPEQAAEALKSTDPTHAVKPEQLTPIIETQPDGTKVWNGWIMGEPAFPMKSNIFYDSNLHVHIDRNTNQPEFDPQKIFKSFDELTPAEKADFKNNLVDIKVDQDGIAVFARKGGIVRDGDTEKNTSFFFGTKGAEVEGVEQISLIPVPSELCVTDPELSGATRSFRQGAIEFRDNPDARDGKITVKWFNPETKRFETLDGRLVAQLAKQKVDLSVLEQTPANTPLSPEDMSHRFGGKADKWVFEPKTGEWFYEAFSYKPGVHYVAGIGPEDQTGKVLFGAEQANSATSKVFDFGKLDTSALVENVDAPGSFQATLFARQGTVGDPATNNHSWYTWGNGNISLNKPGIEQMTFMPNNPKWCSPADVPNELFARAKTLATEQPNPAITALFWDSVQFIQVVK